MVEGILQSGIVVLLLPFAMALAFEGQPKFTINGPYYKMMPQQQAHPWNFYQNPFYRMMQPPRSGYPDIQLPQPQQPQRPQPLIDFKMPRMYDANYHHRMIQTVDPVAYMQLTVRRESRDQSALMAEKYLDQFETSCVQRSFCQVAATTKQDEYTNAAKLSVSVINKMLEDVTNDNLLNRLTNIQGLVSSYQVGKRTMNATMCKWLFPCKVHQKEVEVARVSCDQTAKLCPGFSISCALCGLFLPDTCGFVCPIAGLYCGVAGYACPPAQTDEMPAEDASDAEEDASDVEEEPIPEEDREGSGQKVAELELDDTTAELQADERL